MISRRILPSRTAASLAAMTSRCQFNSHDVPQRCRASHGVGRHFFVGALNAKQAQRTDHHSGLAVEATPPANTSDYAMGSLHSRKIAGDVKQFTCLRASARY
jgi:hypothetical protein